MTKQILSKVIKKFSFLKLENKKREMVMLH